MAAAAGRQAPRRAIFSRVFWAAAAVVLIALLLNSLLGSEWKRVHAPGTKDAPLANGELRWRETSLKLTVTGLPSLPPGRVYQLWHVGVVATPIPQATFTLDAEGSLVGSDTMHYAIAKGQAFALTIEPAGGSRSPTLPIYWLAPAAP
jgi:anti-sigma-K factor RskA